MALAVTLLSLAARARQYRLVETRLMAAQQTLLTADLNGLAALYDQRRIIALRQAIDYRATAATGDEMLLLMDRNGAILAGTRELHIPLSSHSAADPAYITEWQSTNSSASADLAMAYDTPIMKALETNLVGLDGRKITPFTLTNPEKIEVIAVYSSSSRCGPCHAFTPYLSSAYKSLKRKYDNFELVLLTADPEKEAGEGYVKE